MNDMNKTITAPLGFRAAGVSCGLKESSKPDLALLVCDVMACSAGCFTTNRFRAAPVEISLKHIANGYSRAIVVNSGNANACTGQRGIEDASDMAKMLATKLNIDDSDVLVASTGVIGQQLDMLKISTGINQAFEKLSSDKSAGLAFSQAILTTDTKIKTAYTEFHLPDEAGTIKIAGSAKGSGMISPNMATMLAFITTDAKIAPSELRKLIRQAVDKTFNRITVDAQMSTNDSVYILASGLACENELTSKQLQIFGGYLTEICKQLAIAIVRDGEGATKTFHITVEGAKSSEDGHKIARAVADSLLVKTAIHGGDPNWGRIISAAGACNISFDPNKLICIIGDEIVFERGVPAKFDTEKLKNIMRQDDIDIILKLAEGTETETVHTCDLSKEYIDINAFYHT